MSHTLTFQRVGLCAMVLLSSEGRPERGESAFISVKLPIHPKTIQSGAR